MVRLCHINLLLQLHEIWPKFFCYHRIQRIHSQQISNFDALNEGSNSLTLQLLLLMQAAQSCM